MNIFCGCFIFRFIIKKTQSANIKKFLYLHIYDTKTFTDLHLRLFSKHLFDRISLLGCMYREHFCFRNLAQIKQHNDIFSYLICWDNKLFLQLKK